MDASWRPCWSKSAVILIVQLRTSLLRLTALLLLCWCCTLISPSSVHIPCFLVRQVFRFLRLRFDSLKKVTLTPLKLHPKLKSLLRNASNHPKAQLTRAAENKSRFKRIGFFRKWRRGRDSNPRYPCEVHSISSAAPSATRSPLHVS